MEIASWIIIGIFNLFNSQSRNAGACCRRDVRCDFDWRNRRVDWRHRGDDLLAGCVSSLRPLRVVRRSHRRDDTSVFVSLFRHPIRKANSS